LIVPILDGIHVQYIDATFSESSRTGNIAHELYIQKTIVGKGVGLGSDDFRINELDFATLHKTDPIQTRKYIRGTAHNTLPDGWGGEGVFWFENIEDSSELESTETGRIFLEKASNPNGTKFWRYRRNASAIYSHLNKTEFCIIKAQTSSTWFFSFWPRTDIFDQTIICFGSNCAGLLSVLSSSFHQAWVGKYGGLMKTDTTYSPSNFFYTFPLPYNPISQKNYCLAELAFEYLKSREAICKKHNIGMTDAFGKINDSSNNDEGITRIRKLSIIIDETVAKTYGFHDIQFNHDFYETFQGIRYTISEPARLEVLQRLLKLNHKRYAEEVAQGLHDKKKPTTKKAAPKKKAASKPANHEASLFDMEGDE
jgi:hypothetical protein